MKKRIISLLICLIMTVGLLPVAVNAADLPFTDVKTDAWYYNDIKIAYEGGLINGKSATVFDPDANLTYAEAVKLAACMHQKSTTGEVTLKNVRIAEKLLPMPKMFAAQSGEAGARPMLSAISATSSPSSL